MPKHRSAPRPHQRDAPRYILRRQLNVDGKFMLPGEEVPQAAAWPNLYAYLDLGWIEVLDESEDDGPMRGYSHPLKEQPAETVVDAPVGQSPVDDQSAVEELSTGDFSNGNLLSEE